jgi:hypothetical protein
MEQKSCIGSENQVIFLTSTYELTGNHIVFEVTSCKEPIKENGL